MTTLCMLKATTLEFDNICAHSSHARRSRGWRYSIFEGHRILADVSPAGKARAVRCEAYGRRQPPMSLMRGRKHQSRIHSSLSIFKMCGSDTTRCSSKWTRKWLNYLSLPSVLPIPLRCFTLGVMELALMLALLCCSCTHPPHA